MAPVDFEAATPAAAKGAASVAFRYGIGVKGKGLEDGRRKLGQPRGIRLAPDGALLVADYRNHCVYRFSKGRDAKGSVLAGSEGQCLPTVDPLKDIDKPLGPPEGEGRLLKRPIDVAPCNGSGYLVMDTETCRVQQFSAPGRNSTSARVVAPIPGEGGAPLKPTVNTPEGWKYPRSFIPCEDGSLLICDTWSHRILRFPPPGSAESTQIVAGTPNSSGKGSEQLAFPSGIALAPDGSLLVADMNNHRIQRFAPGSSKGETIAGSASCEPGADLHNLSMPTGVCVDPQDGSLLVTDRMNSRLLRFPSTSAAASENVPEVVAGPEALDRPWGVCVGTCGTVYVSDERRAVVLRFNPRGGESVEPVDGEPEEEDEKGEPSCDEVPSQERVPVATQAVAVQQSAEPVAVQRPTVSDDCMALD